MKTNKKPLQARRLEFRDLPIRVSWLNSSEVSSQMVIEVPLSLSGTEQWFAQVPLDPTRRDFVFVEDGAADERRVVAMGGLTDIDTINVRAELYILVDPQRMRSGFGGRAVKWLCNFGFITLNLSKIYLYTLDHNDGARRLYDRLGFQHEGVLRRHTRHQGGLVDRHIQSLLRSEWNSLAWRTGPPILLDLD